MALLAIGFLMKAAQLPFRIDWQMHPALAPTPVSGYISSVLLKSAILGLIKLFMLMGGGFMLLALNARHGAADGQASMGMMVAGLAMMGFAELFIDPVAMAQITRLNMPGVTGVLTGIYMLATGAVANWLAGVVAQQTTESQISDTAIAAYQHFFAQMGEWTLGCVAVMVIIAFAAACSVGKRRAAAGEITGGGA